MSNNFEISKILSHIRSNLTKTESRDLQRLFHGRGGTFDGLGFLNADFYPPAIFITLYEERSPGWLEEFASELMGSGSIASVVFQDRTSAPWKNSFFGEPLPLPHMVEENGLRYLVSLGKGENPGIFPDMGEGRSYLRSISSGRKVLNLFSYTCAFSVAAIAGGASYVLNVDMNSNSLSRGRENHRLNNQSLESVSFMSHNILKSFGKIVRSGPFDLVVIDPPPSQGTSFNLERDYGKILRRSAEFLTPGGEILACLNSPRYDFSWFEKFIEENSGSFRLINRLEGGESFPESGPGAGLKILHFQRNTDEPISKEHS
ncbi:class I SAM-dependent methyltransferase [Spirochaeta isovalerica]|uniref:23S rRNA (Cytosine1962-C5)-methyltransferase n=1 Tax=Spirochaeta isovalerica TaxID=150 RepID=A0A841REI2_9SPIO|nr:class I SAM-dependent methyltransferase [Spirochaeta isovalerica]MBB6481028.1 23S rRNA (cytosine1962-C5)-methyltransferase [Spirochaeta isovalerica]